MARDLRSTLVILALPLLPLALACPKAPREGGSASPDPEPGSHTPFDFSRVIVATHDGDRWSVTYPTGLPDAAIQRIQAEEDGVDGFTNTLDPALLGDAARFTVGDPLALVTDRGLVDAKIRGLGGFLGGGNDWVVGALDVTLPPGPAPAGPMLAVVGPRPHADARVQVIPTVPLGPRVGAAFDAGKLVLAPRLADYGEWLGSDVALDPARLHVGTECARAYVPALAPGFEQLLVVHCSNEEQLQAPVSVSAVVALGDAPQEIVPWDVHRWSLELRAVVDLDGDGIDELWIEASGHEWSSTSLYCWDGKGYVEAELVLDAL